MEQRRLGRTGHESSVLIYGGAALDGVDQGTADASLHEALAAGINHFDTATSYGTSEERMGPFVADARARIFLATKVEARDRAGARADLEGSLRLLRTDRLDLVQLHAICDRADLDRVTGPGGALGALLAARDEGLVAAIGITGHGPQAAAVHTEALRRFPFDTVLTPLNAVLARDAGFRAAFASLVTEVRRCDAGLMTIKTLARRAWEPDAPPAGFSTWYEPFHAPELVRAALSWVLAQPGVTGVATAGDVRLLPLLVAAERDRLPPDAAAELLDADRLAASPFVGGLPA